MQTFGGVVRCLGICLLASACAEGVSATEKEIGVELTALTADASWMGKSLEQWAVEYARWFYSATECEGLPTNDEDGSQCERFQDAESSVFFFDRSAYTEGGSKLVERTLCEVPSGKAILVPVSSFIGDNAGMKMALPDMQLEQAMSEVKSSMRELALSAGSKPIAPLDEYGLGPIRFSYHVPPTPNRYGCDDSSEVHDEEVNPSFLAGYFVLFEPPAVGTHELEYASVLTIGGHDLSIHVRTLFEVVDKDR